MILNTTSMTLRATLATTVAASQPDVIVDFRVWNIDGQLSRPGTQITALNNTSTVPILASPPVGQVYDPSRLSIYNKDTTTATVTIQVSSSTLAVEVKQTIPASRSLCWEQTNGWYLI